MRRVCAALRMLPPPRFRSLKDPGTIMYCNMEVIAHALDTGVKRTMPKEEVGALPKRAIPTRERTAMRAHTR